MLFGQDRNQLRSFYCQTWSDYQEGRPLQPLQNFIVEVIKLHPEYHPLLDNPDTALNKEYLPDAGETNPFLHMGLHIAIHEQISTNRPSGINELYEQLLVRIKDQHELEHKIMDCMVEMIWQSQQQGNAPDENAYMECVRSLLKT